MPAKQPAVAVPSGGDRRIIVGVSRSDDPRAAPPAEAADTAKHGARRSEISEDHLELAAPIDVAADASPPRVLHAQRAAELPLHGTSVLAETTDHPAQRLQPRVLSVAPPEEGFEIVRGAGYARPVDPDPQVAPVPRTFVAEISIVDIRAAGDRALAIGDDQLLVVAHQVARSVARVEHAGLASA